MIKTGGVMMIFFDIDGTLIDHKRVEKNAVMCFYECNVVIY